MEPVPKKFGTKMKEDKTMTNKIYSACMTVVMLAIIAGGCSKNDINDPQEPAKVQKYHMVVNAAKTQDNPANSPRRVLGLDGNTLNASWAIGEEVTVYNVTKNTAISGVLTAQSNGACTTLSGDLTGSIEPSDILTLKFLSPNYTGQDGTLEYISASCDYAEASVTVASVSSGNITTTADAVFENKQAIVKFTLISKADGSTLLNPTTLTINDGTNDIITLSDIHPSTYATNGNGVLFVAMPGFADKNIKLSATVGTKTYIYEKDNVTFANGNYYLITMKVTPEGALPYGFSVSPTKKVLFSKGNLQYQASTNTWRFADNQWNFVGNDEAGNVYENSIKCDNSLIGSTYNGWIDLFGWGTGNSPTKISSDNTNDYTIFSDWGNNVICNGGNIINIWRTLNKEEWGYLFLGRENASILFGLGSIEGINGLILLPDLWSNPEGVSFNPSTTMGLTNQGNYFTNSTGDNFAHNTYTFAQWSEMELAGAIFLPAAGAVDRFENNVYSVNSRGFYWSTTSYEPKEAYNLRFYSDELSTIDISGRSSGISVRLVQDIE